eukprot:scaffold17507_cov37-Cyclotella_meneghiniana.AAC.7
MRAPDDEMTYHEQERPQNNAGEKFRNSSFRLFTSASLPSCQFEQIFQRFAFASCTTANGTELPLAR